MDMIDRLKLREYTQPYAKYDAKRGVFESLIAFFWLLLFISSSVLYFHLLPIMLVATVPMSSLSAIKLFIVLHDLSHNNLFSNRVYRYLLGEFIGVLLWTPFLNCPENETLYLLNIFLIIS